MKITVELNSGFTNVLRLYRERIENEGAEVVFSLFTDRPYLIGTSIHPLLIPSCFTSTYPDFYLFFDEHTRSYYFYLGSDGTNSIMLVFSSFDDFIGV